MHNCSTRTVLRWINIYKNSKKQDNKNEVYKNQQSSAEKNDEEILKEIEIELKRKKRKKRKGKSTIPIKVKNFIFKKCANKTTGGKDNIYIRKIVAI